MTVLPFSSLISHTQWDLHKGILLQSKLQEAAVLAEVGSGGFSMQEFELIQQLGRLSWVCKGPPPGSDVPPDHSMLYAASS